MVGEQVMLLRLLKFPHAQIRFTKFSDNSWLRKQKDQIDSDVSIRIGQDGASTTCTSSCGNSKMRQSGPIEIGVWCHLVLVNTSDNRGRLYRNGVQTNQKAANS